MKSLTAIFALSIAVGSVARVDAAAGDHNWAQSVSNFTSTGASLSNGALFYVGNDSVFMRKSVDGLQLGATWKTPTSNTIQNFPVAVPLQDGLTYVFVGGNDGVVRLHDPATGGERAAFDWQVGPIGVAAFSPNGMLAAVGGANGLVVWDVE